MRYEVVALVADTHGVLLPATEAACQLADSLILHAVLLDGNCTTCKQQYRRLLPSFTVIVLQTRPPPGVALSHGGFPPNEPPALESLISQEKPDIVVFGHSHQPRVEIVGSRIYINRPKRFKLPQCMALLVVSAEDVSSECEVSPPSPSHQIETSSCHATDTQEISRTDLERFWQTQFT
eukprot:jgi/Chlat1/7528/Chrsp62S07044